MGPRINTGDIYSSLPSCVLFLLKNPPTGETIGAVAALGTSRRRRFPVPGTMGPVDYSSFRARWILLVDGLSRRRRAVFQRVFDAAFAVGTTPYDDELTKGVSQAGGVREERSARARGSANRYGV